MTLTELLIAAIAGAAGGNIGANLFKHASLGTAGDTIAGVIGGAVLGLGLGGLNSDSPADGLTMQTVLLHLVGGAVGGGVLAVVAGVVRGRTRAG